MATLPPNAEGIKGSKVSIFRLFLIFLSKQNDLKKFIHRANFLENRTTHDFFHRISTNSTSKTSMPFGFPRAPL